MRLLVVEDEPKVSGFLVRGLREERYAVDLAEDGEAALALAADHDYDLVLLDVNLPRRDGFSVLSELRATGHECRVLLLTARDAVHDRVRGLDAGADDYLVKPFAFEELLARVRSLLRRRSAETSVLAAGDLVLDAAARAVRRGGREVNLTAREFALLEFLLRHKGEVLSRQRIGEHVWDRNFDPLSNVIEVTLYHVREKIDRGHPEPLVHTVRGAGYTIRESR